MVRYKGFKSVIAIIMAIMFTFGTAQVSVFAEFSENVSDKEEYGIEFEGQQDISENNSQTDELEENNKNNKAETELQAEETENEPVEVEETVSNATALDANYFEFSLSEEILEAFTVGGETFLEIESAIATVTLNAELVNEIRERAAGQLVKLVVETIEYAELSEEGIANIGYRNIYSVTLKISDTQLSLNNSSISVFLPYEPGEGEEVESLHVYSVNGEGDIFFTSDYSYDYEKKGFIFTSYNLGMFAVGDCIIEEEMIPFGSFDIWPMIIDTGFEDVAENHWALEYIDYMAEEGYVNGVGDNLFAPDRCITRAEFVTILFNISGSDLPSGMTKFNDVSAIAWYAPYVAWALDNGITYGTSEDTFSPDEMITYCDMNAMTMRYLELKGAYAEEHVKAEQDTVESTAPYAVDSIDFIVQNNMSVNADAGYLPSAQSVTRAQSVTILAMISMENN